MIFHLARVCERFWGHQVHFTFRPQTNSYLSCNLHTIDSIQTRTHQTMSAVEQLSQLQKNLQELMQTRTKLETQFQENKIVKEEFDTLEDDAKVYKLMGPVLLSQDKSEAEDNVNKRLEFITAEIEKVEKNMKSMQVELQTKRAQFAQAQAQAQAQVQAQTQPQA